MQSTYAKNIVTDLLIEEPPPSLGMCLALEKAGSKSAACIQFGSGVWDYGGVKGASMVSLYNLPWNYYRRTMDLQLIVERFAEGLGSIDSEDEQPRVNQRTREPYLQGLPVMSEPEVASRFRDWWMTRYPSELPTRNNMETEVPYPTSHRSKLDILLTPAPSNPATPEWAIEVKRIQFVGDNGKRNDFGVPKMLSPYLKDRSLIHDIHRLIDEPMATKKAVLGYAFSYDFSTCDSALSIHPSNAHRINEIRKVCHVNNPDSGELDARVLIRVADLQLKNAGVVTDLIMREFNGLWKHPCGGNGLVFAWQVI